MDGSESKLWSNFKNGDQNSYALIYRNFYFLLLQYGKKITEDEDIIKDCIHDLFIQLWNNRQNLSNTTSIKFYLFTALKRKLIEAFRQSSTIQEKLKSIDFLDDDVSEEAVETKLLSEQKVHEALNRLSKHQKKVLELKYFANYSNNEIANEMAISTQSVYNTVFKALKSLRKEIASFIFTIV